ncbi:hypothetical protein [Streptomyces sp. H39-S7]|nr:hypothetical protein [Streptomyces sp. H39-S7]MCZ4118485.1 hypothetical protein [Streptomyces sp. H39-S7]
MAANTAAAIASPADTVRRPRCGAVHRRIRPRPRPARIGGKDGTTQRGSA